MYYKIVEMMASVLIYQIFCCTTCNPVIQRKIYDSAFFPNLVTMLSAFIVLALIVLTFTIYYKKRHAAFVKANPGFTILDPVPLGSASIVLGIGLGGFVDGIVLHQLLQWHEMLSNKLPPVTVVDKSVNMFWDGIFHAFTWMVVIIGVIMLWKLLDMKGINRSGNLLFGGFMTGWGIFNIVEGVIDHQLLKLHNVKEAALYPEIWNYGFLGVSVMMLAVGYFCMRRERNLLKKIA